MKLEFVKMLIVPAVSVALVSVQLVIFVPTAVESAVVWLDTTWTGVDELVP